MITKEAQNHHKLAEIWLRCSLISHGFVDDGYWKDNFEGMRDTYLPASENYVYRDSPDGEIAGFISLRGNHIEALFVDTNRQGRGTGRKLMDYAKGLRNRLTVTVYEKNTGAVQFYAANGFRETSRNIDSPTGEMEINMEWKQ